MGSDCREAAEIAMAGMRRAGYADACYCQGRAYPGGKYHAWVEFTREDGRRWILDPYELLRERIGPGRVLVCREEWPEWYFKRMVGMGKDKTR